MKYKVGLVGCGGISGAVADPPFGRYSYRHLAGVFGNPRLELAAAADVSREKLDTFRAKWKSVWPDTRCYNSVDAMLERERLDIVDICVRGQDHFPVTMRVLEARPRAILLEKAPTSSLAEMDAMLAAAKARGVPITVSYSRHWSPPLLRMQQLLRDGFIGKIDTVIGYCPGWILSMNSHMTDMICQFASYRPTSVRAHGAVRPPPEMKWHTIEVPPGFEPEPHLDTMTIEFANGVSGVHVGSWNRYERLTCDIFGSEGRVTIPFIHEPAGDSDHGIQAFKRDGKPIDLGPCEIPPLRTPFGPLFEQIVTHLDGGPLPDCTNEQWVAVHEIGFAGIESLLTNRRVEIPTAHRQRRIYIL